MSLYVKENASYLSACFESLINQTVQANQIILVEDGPLTEELYATLEKWQKILPIERVKLPNNVGLGMALNHGLELCRYDLIARMDTDDICHPSRFEKQLKIFKNQNIDVCGSWISEFYKNSDICISYRKLPENHDDIVRYSQRKNPMNHPSVMYRKSIVFDVQRYNDVLYFEDYYLWLKLLNNGAIFYNIQEPLVFMRSDEAQLSRRGGRRYAFYELNFFKLCFKNGFMTREQVVINTIIRFPIRMLPSKLLGKIYKIIRFIG